MTLTMARPWKHPETGIYWLREAVPEDLRALVGKPEEKRSLKTRDPAESKLRHLEALADLEARWANLRAGSSTLSEIDAFRLATPFYDHWVALHQANPSEQTTWRTDLAERLWAPVPPWKPGVPFEVFVLEGLDPDSLKVREMESHCLAMADECLASHGMKVDDASRRKLARATSMVIQKASLTLEDNARGGFLAAGQLPQLLATPMTKSGGEVPISL